MTSMIRRLKRTTKKAAKYKFTASLQELLLVVEDASKRPETVVVSFMHRRRKISSRERPWEPSFSKPEQCVIVWPEQAPENVDILTTLYKGPNDDTFDDKEWMIVIEQVNEKGKRNPIAAVPLNIRLFVLDQPDHKSQLKLKLRCLSPSLSQCSLVILLSGQLLKEGFRDDVSRASSVSAADRSSREQSVGELLADTKDVDTREQIERVTDQIHELSQPHREVGVDNRTTAQVRIERVAEIEKVETDKADPKVRPQWRVSDQNKSSPSPDIVKEQLARIPAELLYKVDENSQPVLVPNGGTLKRPTQSRSKSPRAPSRDRQLQPVDNENVIQWAKRVTEGYYGVKVNDSGKCWQSGLALCAILHAYRPELITYDDLDFSDTMNGRKANVNKAFITAQLLGISDIPDESLILTPDKTEITKLLARIKKAVEGVSDLPTPTTGSDHRISLFFPVTDAEKKIIEEIAKMKEQREAEDAVDYTNVPSVPTTSARSSTLERRSNGVKKVESEEGFGTPELRTWRSMRSSSPSRQEQLKKKAQQMLDNSIVPIEQTADDERRRQEARELIKSAASRGNAAGRSVNRNPSNLSFRSMDGSNSDLRRIELVRPSVTIQSFKKRDPSPVLQRKRYEPETPHLPAISRGPVFLKDKSLQQRTVGEVPMDSHFDRVRRFGSMRGQELRESISQIANYYRIQDPFRGSQTSINEQSSTPKRKMDKSQWQRDVDDVTGCQEQHVHISERLGDVTQQADAIQKKIAETEKGSSEEAMLLETYIKLTNEKNSLVGKQEYFNIIENIREVMKEIEKLNKELAEISKSTSDTDDYFKSEQEKERTQKTMDLYLDAIKRKEHLTEKIIETEQQLEEDEEHLNNLTLDRVSNFVRGSDEPLTASKRLMTWLRG